jgi:dipeptidyl aminopeptidase/acylaminoacyl peptidase
MRKLPLLLLLLSTISHAQIDKNLDSLYAVVNYSQSSLSPDGKKLAWVESVPGKAPATARHRVIRLRDLTRDSSPQRLTAGDGKKTCVENAVAWSPDSKRLVFLSNCADGKQAQLYIAKAEGGQPRKLTSLSGFVASPTWSPDGKQIALLFTENAVRNAGPTEPTAVETGVISETFYEQRLTLIDPESGKAKQISPADIYVYEYDWSPDSSQFTFTAAKGSGDNNWWLAQLFTMPASGGEPRLILKPAAQIAVPRWSPDAKSIAFIGGIMSDEGSTGGDVFLVPAESGPAKNITPNRKSSPAYLSWTSPDQLLITERVDGASAITTLNTATGATEMLWKTDESIRAGSDDLSISLTKDGKTASVIRTSWANPPEVWAGPIGDWKPVTSANKSAKPEWGKAEKIHWVSDNSPVQGWLLYPKDFDAARKYPMVVSIHGGPAANKSASWPVPGFDLSLLAAEGYFVFFPNPRGSYGGGEAFTQANVKDFGYGDLRDVMAGVDQVLKTVPIDPSRLGVGGWSYGGYMTMWTVTQTNRFKAAVAGAGIANWQSYYGQNAIDEWMIPYFGASVYDDPSVYAKSSPITFIKSVKTPTLIVVGERDAECPAPQSYEFWHALKTQGVKTELVVYPGEGHGFQDPKHREDVLKRTVNWFNEILK